MLNKPVTIEDCRDLVEKLLASRAKGTELGTVSPIIWERGYLTGLLARLAFEDYNLRQQLQRMLDRH